MDREHHSILARLAPPSTGQKLRMMLEFARDAAGDEVPDPYYGGFSGFEEVYAILDRSCAHLLDALQDEEDARAPSARAAGQQSRRRAGFPSVGSGR